MKCNVQLSPNPHKYQAIICNLKL